MPADTLNSLQHLAGAINSDAIFDASMKEVHLKSTVSYVTTQVFNRIPQFLRYDKQDEANIKLLNKSFKINTYHKHEVELSCSSLIGVAPAILDTSVELATSLGNDQHDATHMQNQLNTRADKTTS